MKQVILAAALLCALALSAAAQLTAEQEANIRAEIERQVTAGEFVLPAGMALAAAQETAVGATRLLLSMSNVMGMQNRILEGTKFWIALAKALGAAGIDIDAPIISNLTTGSITESSATVTWATNEPADSLVQLGLDSNYGTNVVSGEFTTAHVMPIGGLTPATTYHFRAVSRDPSGNAAATGDNIFTTASDSEPPPPPPPPPAARTELRLSLNSNRSNSVPLEGQTVAADIFVFIAPETGIQQVGFFLDGATVPVQTERRAPYDLGGTASGGLARPFSTTTLGNGSHTVTAAVSFTDGTTEVVTASFTVAN